VRLLLGACAVFAILGCQTGATTGVTCARDAECASPLACRLGRCRAACVLDRDCPAGTQCLRDSTGAGACSVPADVCTDTSACANGLVCVSSRCVNLCTSLVDCPPDATCRMTPDGRSVCEPLVGDAGSLDASATDAAMSMDALSPSDTGADALVSSDAGADALTTGDAGADAFTSGDAFVARDASAGCGTCPSGQECAYVIADGCTAVPTCVTIPTPTGCGTITFLTACGCDGTSVMWRIGCHAQYPSGYAPTPIAHAGAC